MSFLSKIFKRNLPPKTNLENFTNIPHIEKVLLWFLKNDKQMQIINSEAIHKLFKEGIRPECNKNNNPDILAEKLKDVQKIKSIERWLALKIWLDLIEVKKIEEKSKLNLKRTLKEKIDYIGRKSDTTLKKVGVISEKYNLDSGSNINLEVELSKIESTEEKKEFKNNYLFDALISSELRLLAWFYKELFNEEYKIDNLPT